MNAIKKLHAHLIVTGQYRHPRPITKVLLSYAHSTTISDARLVLHQIDEPATSLWNTMIRGLASGDVPTEAIAFYSLMRREGSRPDNRTFPFVLKACARGKLLAHGSTIHTHAMRLGFVQDVFVSNALIHLYASSGEMACAFHVFDEMPLRDVVSWNSLICGITQHGHLREALDVFQVMRAEKVMADKVTMVKIVSACTRLGEWELAESMVRYIEENGVEVDTYLGNTLIDLHGRRGAVESARRVFSEMKERNVVTYNTMIAAYAKGGCLGAARKVFDGMPERDLISWSSMITGYSQSGCFSGAVALFREMQRAEVQPDEIVLVSVLSACAHLGALPLGKWIHNYIRKSKIKADVYVGNSLIDMYSKCGCTAEALKVFVEMKEKDAMSWNSTILGLATNGYVRSAFEVFYDMLKQGFEPSEVTFLAVLVACAHSGLVDKGLEIFNSMKEVHNVEPKMKHYGCVVDLLGRAGELDRALRFITEMPLMPGPTVWRILLGACKLHGNLDMAEIATRELMKLDPGNSGNYVLASNTYAGAEKWKEAMEVRVRMTDNHVHKGPAGCSAIEANDMEDYEFITPDVPAQRNTQVVFT